MGTGSEPLNPASTLFRGLGPSSSLLSHTTLTLSVRVTSAPRVSSMRITSMCLCSAAQMMGVHPPLSCGWGERKAWGAAPALPQQPGLLAKTAYGQEYVLWSQTQREFQLYHSYAVRL